MTPAIASEPYWAAAPSRRTSTRLSAMEGMRLMSTAEVPRPTEPLMLSSDAVWRRLPLIRTSVWSGPSPRSVAGRTTSVPSVMEGWGKLKLGNCSFSSRLVSVKPDRARLSATMTSMGTGLSATVRPLRRVPVTTTVTISSAASAVSSPLVCP